MKIKITYHYKHFRPFYIAEIILDTQIEERVRETLKRDNIIIDNQEIIDE